MPGPLAGVRVLDAATLLAAPLAASLLGEFGAEVIKVEQPGVGDPVRNFPPFRGDASLHWKMTGRNKKSVTVNLRTDAGQAVFKQLVAASDVVVMNYRPSTMHKWRIDFDQLVTVRPDLVMLHLTAFGRTGPYANRPGFARIAESFGGLTYRTGYPDRPPNFAGYALGDGIGGIYGAYAIMLSLRERDRTGRPQLVDLGLYEPILRMMEDFIVDYGTHGRSATRAGNTNPLISPNGMYPTSDQQYLVLPVSTERMWERLVVVMDQPDLLTFGDNTARLTRRAEIDERITEFTERHTLAMLVKLFEDAGVACGPVYSAADIASDPHIRDRRSVVEVVDPTTGEELLMQAPAGRFSGFTPSVGAPGPDLGEHTDEVLSGLLRYSSADIAELRASGTI